MHQVAEDTFRLVVETESTEKKQIISKEMSRWLHKHNVSLQFESLENGITGYTLYIMDQNKPYAFAPIFTYIEDLVQWWEGYQHELTEFAEEFIVESHFYGTVISMVSMPVQKEVRLWLKNFPAIV